MRVSLLMACICSALIVAAQVKLPAIPDSVFSAYYHQRVSLFREMPDRDNEIVFLGNSITDGADWSELFNDPNCLNRGISGDISAGILKRLDEVTSRKPSRIFLLIGTNDLARLISADSLAKNVLLIADFISQESPSSKVFVQSILPVNDSFKAFTSHTRNTSVIRKVNSILAKKARMHNYSFIDLFSSFADASGKLKKRFTNDGLHLSGEGYLLWKHLVYPHVYGLQEKVSLIPYPRSVRWQMGSFFLKHCDGIYIHDSLLLKEAERLQTEIAGMGHKLPIVVAGKSQGQFITLQKQHTGLPSTESYLLRVNENSIVITGDNLQGIFNGTRTLLQLLVDGVAANACEISDYPAFEWRGFMIDAGRNFQSMDLLKQQIDVMAAYKMNIFHFHITEDIAWRLQIKKYPQLTRPENMERDKGLFYSANDLKELIRYCKERYITLIPEIDMPGHSGAFRRAMKTDMQTPEGIRIIKEILNEVMDTYDLEYLHIGGDEVKITNPGFIPDITSLIHSRGIKTIGWSPGANLDAKTYRQLWMAEEPADTNAMLIDSRHLYLNHMDPLESVVTIFHRELAGKQAGDSRHKGAILCVWHDRRVNKAEDIIAMNPVYPGLVTFAERSWRGGGKGKWTTLIGAAGSREYKEFEEFEKRLTDHQQGYFKNKPFPYRAQAGIEWRLEGPKLNGRNDSLLTVFGGTIILRHWWAPLIQSALPDPQENCTWYATAKFWSPEAKVMPSWVGFNNLSRSPATDSPPAGQWDEKNSAIWVNGELISPPQWKHGGMKGNSETPLIDEGYEYREPTLVPFRKGWNTVRIKLPVGTFKGRDWQNPVKWMFTFIPLQ